MQLSAAPQELLLFFFLALTVIAPCFHPQQTTAFGFSFPILAGSAPLADDASSDNSFSDFAATVAAVAPARHLFGLRGKPPLDTRIDLPLRPDSLANRLIQGSLNGSPSLTESQALLAELQSKHPTMLSSFVSGRSVEGREMRVWVLGKDAPSLANEWSQTVWDAESGKCVASASPLSRPSLLLTALHHAREPASLTVTLYAAVQLLDLGTSPPPPGSAPLHQLAAAVCAELLQSHVFLILPFVNPDGYAAIEATGHRDIRKNRRPTCAELSASPPQQGVDLNRNYDYNFDSLHSPCDAEEYEGPYAFSEPETQAVRCLVETLKPTAALNFHGYGGFWTRPFNCCKDKDVPEPLNSVYEELARAVNVTGFGPAPRMPLLMYATTGEADDWMLAKAGVLAMSPEVGHERFGFWPPAAVVPEINEETFWHILDVAIKAGPALSVTAAPDGKTRVVNHGLGPLKQNEIDIVAFPLNPAWQMRFPPPEFFSSRSVASAAAEGQPSGANEDASMSLFTPFAWTRNFRHRRRVLLTDNEESAGSGTAANSRKAVGSQPPQHGILPGPLAARSIALASVTIPTREESSGGSSWMGLGAKGDNSAATAVCVTAVGSTACHCGVLPGASHVVALVPLLASTEPCRLAVEFLPPRRKALYPTVAGTDPTGEAERFNDRLGTVRSQGLPRAAPVEASAAAAAAASEQGAEADGHAETAPSTKDAAEPTDGGDAYRRPSTVVVAAAAAGGLAVAHSLCLCVAARDSAVQSRGGRLARRYAIAWTGLFCCLPPCLKLQQRLRAADERHSMEQENYELTAEVPVNSTAGAVTAGGDDPERFLHSIR